MHYLRGTRDFFAALEELHVSYVPVHHKYPQIVALGIRGEYKKPFALGIISWRRADNFFSVGEDHLNLPPRLPVRDFLRFLVLAVAPEVFNEDHRLQIFQSFLHALLLGNVALRYQAKGVLERREVMNAP